MANLWVIDLRSLGSLRRWANPGSLFLRGRLGSLLLGGHGCRGARGYGRGYGLFRGDFFLARGVESGWERLELSR